MKSAINLLSLSINHKNNMIKAVISGDIVSSTSLTNADRDLVERNLKRLLVELKNSFNIYGRVIKGDYLECVVLEPSNALRIALIIKGFVKSIHIESTSSDKKVNLFKTHGIRLAIGYGELSRFDPEKGIIDGEAIYLSGRTINETTTYNKKRIVIKNTLFFISNNQELNNEFEPILALIDVLMWKATSRQCEVLYLKLMKNSEIAISKRLRIAQSVVNNHSTSVGWNAIEKAVKRFSEVIKAD